MRDMAELIRARDWGRAESSLVEVTGQAPPAIEVEGWPELDAALSTIPSEASVTAIGLDLSNYNDAADGDDWWDKEPCVEVSAYDDHAFPFSTATDDEVLAAGASYAAPWTGRMHGLELPYLTTRGLRDLNGRALRSDDRYDDPLWWWMHLRFHQAVARALESRGLALVVPVVVGSHDTGRWLVGVHRPSHVSDHRVDTERILAEQEVRRAVERDAETERVIEHLRWMRSQVRGDGFLGRGGNKDVKPYADAMASNFAKWSGLPRPKRSLARMSDREVEELIDAYRASRRR